MGIEADQAFVRGEQDGGHRGGEEEVGCEGVSLANKVCDGAEGEHGKGNGEERSAEEAHGGGR